MDWEWETAQVLTKRQGEEERFTEWVSNLREANDTLSTNLHFYILAERMRNHLLLHCHDNLCCEYSIGNKDGCYHGIKEFLKWLWMISDLDLAFAACKSQISKHLAAALAALTKSHLKNVSNMAKSSQTAKPMSSNADFTPPMTSA